MVEREVLHMKPNHQYHLSQWGECVYSAPSWKEKRLLYESTFIPIGQNLIVKTVEREVLPMKLNINIIYPNEENVFMELNHETKEDYYVNPCFILIEWRTLILKMVEREVFLMKPKHQCHLSQ